MNICKVCNKEFKKKSCLVIQMRTHTGEKPFSCDLCNRSFTTSGQLGMHRKLHTNERPYSCDLCDKAFRRNDKLKEHKILHESGKRHICPFCGIDFLQRSDLRLHIKKKSYFIVIYAIRHFQLKLHYLSIAELTRVKDHIHVICVTRLINNTAT